MQGTAEETGTTTAVPGTATGVREPALVEGGAETPDLEQTVEYVLADCFFAVGQTVGMRTTVDYEAVTWWHDHFRAKFLTALRRHGDRWQQDRETVTTVGWMLAERAVRHAAGSNSIGLEAARRAAADVERYCQHRARRARQAGEPAGSAGSRVAGFWCLPIPC